MFLAEEFGHTVIQSKSSVQLPHPKGPKKFTVSHSSKSSNNNSQLKARHLEAFSHKSLAQYPKILGLSIFTVNFMKNEILLTMHNLGAGNNFFVLPYFDVFSLFYSATVLIYYKFQGATF